MCNVGHVCGVCRVFNAGHVCGVCHVSVCVGVWVSRVWRALCHVTWENNIDVVLVLDLGDTGVEMVETDEQ